MKDDDVQTNNGSDEDLEKARSAVSGEPDEGSVEVYEEMEHGSTHLSRFRGGIVTVLAVAWSLFQLSLPSFIVVPSEYARAIHLAFAITLVYLTFGPKRFAARSTSAKKPADKSRPRKRWKSVVGIILKPVALVFRWIAILYRGIFVGLAKVPGGDYVLALIAAGSVLYLPLNYEAIAERIGNPTILDITVGIVLLVFLLEAARRAVGPALSVLAFVFVILAFNTQSLPPRLAFKNATLDSVIDTLTLGTSGVYGIPLDVSTSIIFLFVLFGAMLAHAGGGQYFINMAFAAVGHLRAGPAMGAVLASGLTGLVSGSSIANTVTTGTFTIPLMRRAGYPAEKAGAVEVAASTNGQLMPPIMGAAAFIMMEYTATSYFEVVKAAIIPAFISYLALIYITRLEAAKLDLQPIPREDLPPLGKTFLSGLHFLLPLFMLIYMLVIERLSPQLSAFYAICVLAVLIVIANIIKAIRNGEGFPAGLKKSGWILLKSLEMGARNMVPIGVAVAAAGVIVGVVSLGLGNMITSVIEVLSGGQILPLLLITAFFSLILGLGLPTTANYIVMASLTAPAIVSIAAANGYEIPLLAAHLFCFYFGILSDDTPPVGLSAYAASAISRGDPIRTGVQGFAYDIRTALLPFMFVFNTDLILHNVTEWWRIILIFLTGLLALLAFASLTQGWLRRRNTILESLLLGVVVFTLMQPHFTSDRLGIPSWVVWIFGLALFAALYFLQPLWGSTKGKSMQTPGG